MRRISAFVLVIALGLAGLQSTAWAQTVDIWAASATGNIEIIKEYAESGGDMNAKAPSIGLTPLMVAALAGQTDGTKLLLDKGAKPDIRNNENGTALHIAAFFGHTKIVKMLVAKGADVNVRNVRGETPLDTVKGEWNEGLEGLYEALGGYLKLKLDLEKIKVARPKIAGILAREVKKIAAAEIKSTGLRGSYYMNGEIHVNTYGTPEGTPLTKGHWDFKPSWSKTGDMLVFFR